MRRLGSQYCLGFQLKISPGANKYWTNRRFEPAYLSFSLAPFKSFLAPAAFRDRELLAASWKNYLKEGWHEHASEFTKAAYLHNKGHGLKDEDIARAEIGHSFAAIGTTAPATFWLLYHIFSNPLVLADIREELNLWVRDSTTPDRSILMSDIRTKCPILLSTYWEMLRYRGLGNSVRVCLEDTMLDGRFLLKKSSVVIVPQLVQHTSKPVWGEDVSQFNHLRFTKDSGGSSGSVKGQGAKRTAFRAFGGGHNLCPGRNFSTTEIMAMAAIMVLNFDIEAVGKEGSDLSAGQWVDPTWKRTPMISSFQIPDEDIEVRIVPRNIGACMVIVDEESTGLAEVDITNQDSKL